jgi:hypothetical protein
MGGPPDEDPNGEGTVGPRDATPGLRTRGPTPARGLSGPPTGSCQWRWALIAPGHAGDTQITTVAPWCRSWFSVERIWADLGAPEPPCYAAAGLSEACRTIS